MIPSVADGVRAIRRRSPIETAARRLKLAAGRGGTIKATLGRWRRTIPSCSRGEIMRRWTVRLLIVAVVVGLAVAGGAALTVWWKQRATTKFITSPVSRGRVETVVNSTGTIKPVRTVSVGAFVSGPISEVNVDFNSKVRAGWWFGPATVLARIDPKLLQAAVDRDQAALEAQEADLARVGALRDQAKNNYDRARNLAAVNKDYLSDTEMDQYKFALQTAEAQVKLSAASVKQAKAQLQNSKENLGYTKITSPEDGIIIERKVDPGQTVAASFQTPELFTLGLEMDKHMYINASVDEADVGLIHEAQKLGSTVTFTVDAYPGDLFEGKINQIRLNSTTTQNVVTYPVIIEAPNPDLKLMPGMTANLSFQVEAKAGVLRVPAAALRFVPLSALVRPEDRHHVEGLPTVDPNTAPPADAGTAADKAGKAKGRHDRHVWVRDGDLLRAVPVTLGLLDYQNAEVVRGQLVEGQDIVTGIDNGLGPR